MYGFVTGLIILVLFNQIPTLDALFVHYAWGIHYYLIKFHVNYHGWDL